MRGSFLFVFGDLLRRALGRPGIWAGFVGAVTLAAVSLSALVFLQTGGMDQGKSREHWYVLCTLSVLLPEKGINALAWGIREMPGVTGVSFRFAGDTAPGYGTVPERSLIVRVRDEGTARALAKKLPSEEGIEAAETVRYLSSPPASLPPLSRLLALIGLIFAVFVLLLSGRTAFGWLLKHWGREWELLGAAGLSGGERMLPLLTLSLLCGLFGGLVYLALYLGLRGYLGGMEAVRQVAPGYFKAGVFPYLLSFVVAPLLGLLAGGVGILPALLSPRRLPEPELSEG